MAIVLKRRHARAPEVDKMRPVFYQYDVGGRDVPVHRAVRMQVGKRLAQIDRQGTRPLGGKRSLAFHNLGQSVSRHIVAYHYKLIRQLIGRPNPRQT